MGEADVIKKTDTPVTVHSLMDDFSALGLTSGMTVIVHSSLSSLVWVCGGPVAVIHALEEVLGPGGTLVMPTHSTDLSDPSEWGNPSVPRSWWKPIRESMPAYDPHLTPTRNMGAIAERFRKGKDVLRSSHPHFSFCVWGAHATEVVADQPLDFGMGEGSPLAKIYALDGWVLLLGVGNSNNTSLHLAEYRSNYPSKKVIKSKVPILTDNGREWQEINNIRFDSSDFELIGEEFSKSDDGSLVKRGQVGCGKAQFFPQTKIVDYAVDWMEKNRNW